MKRIGSLIKLRRNQLSAAEKRVADYIEENPQPVTGMGVVELARNTGVSQPTVIRFCRKLGFNGFAEFKLQYAQGEAIRPLAVHQDVGLEDSPEEVIRKVANSAISALTQVRDGIDPAQLDAAATLIARAHRIECYAPGAAHVVAVGAQNKLYRLGIPVGTSTDLFTQIMSAGLMGEQDVILAISFTGRAQQLLEVARYARKTNTPFIAITDSASPLARLATVCINVGTNEDFVAYAPMSTPVAFMTVVDMLAMCALLKRPASVHQNHMLSKREHERMGMVQRAKRPSRKR